MLRLHDIARVHTVHHIVKAYSKPPNHEIFMQVPNRGVVILKSLSHNTNNSVG